MCSAKTLPTKASFAVPEQPWMPEGPWVRNPVGEDCHAVLWDHDVQDLTVKRSWGDTRLQFAIQAPWTSRLHSQAGLRSFSREGKVPGLCSLLPALATVFLK